MSAPVPAPELVERYLRCSDRRESESLLNTLICEMAEPVVRRIVRHKLSGATAGRVQDTDDVAHNVLADLIVRLRECREDSDSTPVRDVVAYAATAAHHACEEYFRQAFPALSRLRNRLRYAIENSSEYTVARDANGEWRVTRERRSLLSRFRARTTDDLLRKLEEVLAPGEQSVTFDEASNRVARLLGVSDASVELDASTAELADPAESADARLIRNDRLKMLWQEIRDLPQRQRVALLLSLRDHQGDAALPLFSLTGVATIREIAERLDMPAQELARLWPDLPLDDNALASRLGLTRQQVINLRRSARERLGRRAAAGE